MCIYRKQVVVKNLDKAMSQEDADKLMSEGYEDEE